MRSRRFHRVFAIAAVLALPAQSNQVAYAPRMLQMGFRFAFCA